MKKNRLSLMEVVYIISSIFLLLSGIYTLIVAGNSKTAKTLITMSILSFTFTLYMIRGNKKLNYN